MEFLKFDYIDDEYFERLKNILGGDEEKYNVVLDYYSECIISELESTFEEKAMAFEEWVDTFEESVDSKEINNHALDRYCEIKQGILVSKANALKDKIPTKVYMALINTDIKAINSKNYLANESEV